ncbi:TPA: preprotein translocase subunit SecA [Candidatus Acetothermia bacterium]|nr:preprotein translocase subunit SecA [Candidatus Acetothermia bacterium]
MVSIRRGIDFLFGQTNEQRLRRLLPVVKATNAWAERVHGLSDEDLRAKTVEFRGRLAAGEAVDDLLPEAFACVREAAWRTISLRPFDVQVMGATVLHQRGIAEMKTGEGKTLVATMPAYLNALVGKVHVITVNDYLARRDRHWMGPVYEFMGLTVGLLQETTPPEERRAAYACDILYGTNAQFGFDYLRDHMVATRSQMAQGRLDYAIVDEIDNILIDEARTPLIISGPTADTVRQYRDFARVAKLFKPDQDFEVNEEQRRLSLTEAGWQRAEQILKFDNIAAAGATTARYHLETALRARMFFHRDQQYIVKDGRVIIVDEFTGRMMPDRRYSGGLHQAIEAKENLSVQRESQTLAQITLQHYFRLYRGLAGMTGTAKTEEEEFKQIYGLAVVQIPTNRPLIREALPDVIYRTKKGKFEAVADEVARLHAAGRPALIGTTSIEDSEDLSRLLKRRGLPHQVLNAKYHEKEAVIVAQAGRLGAVTIATNMAGRGTDIVLGGNPEFRARAEADPAEEPDKYAETLARSREEATAEREKIIASADEDPTYRRGTMTRIREWCADTGRAFRPEDWEGAMVRGGLAVLGFQRHEARRIDDQLGGRCGRQGDPGSSQFFLSLEDDLLRIFGGERLGGLMERLGVKEGEAITHNLLTRSIRRAQKRVEERNFEIRKRLLEYDEIMARQREAVYAVRERFLLPDPGDEPDDTALREHLAEMTAEYAEILTDRFAPGPSPEAWDLPGLIRELGQVRAPLAELPADRRERIRADVGDLLLAQLESQWTRLAPHFPTIVRMVLLRTTDENWRQHLLELDELREGIGLRAYGGTDPLVEFRREAHRMFQEMILRSEEEALRFLLSPRLAVRAEPTPGRATTVSSPTPLPLRTSTSTTAAPTATPTKAHAAATGRGDGDGKVGRNDPCPCGSGKKYKHCHGR